MCMCFSELNAFSQIIWRLQPLHFFQPPSGRVKAILEQIISLQFPLLTPSRRAIHYQAEWRWIGLFSFVAVLVITKAIRLFMNLVLVLLSHRGQRLDMNPFCLWRRFCQNYLCSDHNSGLTSLFAMSLCHRITSNETQHVLWSCFVQTPICLNFCIFFQRVEGRHNFPCSWARWEPSQAALLYGSQIAVI